MEWRSHVTGHSSPVHDPSAFSSRSSISASIDLPFVPITFQLRMRDPDRSSHSLPSSL